MDVLRQLLNYYQRLLERQSFPLKDTCRADVQAFLARVQDVRSNFQIEVNKAKHLAQLANDRKVLVG